MSDRSDRKIHLLLPLVMLIILACICSNGSSSGVRQGIEALEACDLMTAKGSFDAAIEDNDEDAEAYYHRGVINYDTGYLEEAIEDFTNAIEFEPDYPEAYYYRGLSYLQMEEEDLAEDDFEIALDGFDQRIEDEPDEAEWYLWRGDVNAKGLDESDDAIDDYDKAIELNPEFAKAYNHRGDITYGSTDDWQAALDDFEIVLDLEAAPCYEIAYAFNYRGFIKDTKLDDQEAAIDDYERAIEANHYYYNPHYWLGKLYYETDEYEDAIDSFDKVLELYPTHANSHNYRGLANFKNKDYETAIEDFTGAMESSPDWATPIKNRGDSYYRNGEYQLAVSDLTRYLTLSPEDTGAMNLLGLVYSKMEDYESAIEQYDKAIEIDPDYVWPYYNSGLANRDAGNIAEAVADFTQFLSLYEKEDDYSAVAKEYIQNNSGPTISELFFASEVDSNYNPINISDTFPLGTKQVFVFGTYSGMSDGVPAVTIFKYNNEELTHTPFNWAAGESGTKPFDGISYSDGSPLSAGIYQFELYYDSALLATGEFTIQ